MASLEDFDVLDELGRGGQAITWRARHKASGDLVALKELHFQRVEGWKTVELFEREAAALASLDHPDIPDYRGAFRDEKDGELTLYLAQELVDGQNLLDELEREGRWSADKATADLARLLEVLIYLASRVPPVVHRDIKPENLIRRPDGGISLVDFGAVYIDEGVTHSSTVIGTPGYMALEQMTGQAVPCSDLYSLVHEGAGRLFSTARRASRGCCRVRGRLSGFVSGAAARGSIQPADR